MAAFKLKQIWNLLINLLKQLYPTHFVYGQPNEICGIIFY